MTRQGVGNGSGGYSLGALSSKWVQDWRGHRARLQRACVGAFQTLA